MAQGVSRLATCHATSSMEGYEPGAADSSQMRTSPLLIFSSRNVAPRLSRASGLGGNPVFTARVALHNKKHLLQPTRQRLSCFP
jgi:hypothetical protein